MKLGQQIHLLLRPRQELDGYASKDTVKRTNKKNEERIRTEEEKKRRKKEKKGGRENDLKKRLDSAREVISYFFLVPQIPSNSDLILGGPRV